MGYWQCWLLSRAESNASHVEVSWRELGRGREGERVSWPGDATANYLPYQSECRAARLSAREYRVVLELCAFSCG